MSCARFESVEDYYLSLDEGKAETLRAAVAVILEDFPELEVKLAWNVPQIHRDGQYVFGVSAAKKHLSLSPWSLEVMEAFRERLEGEFVVTKHLFHVPIGWEVDRGLLGDLVRARLAELDS